jgi:hypothetical protein
VPLVRSTLLTAIGLSSIVACRSIVQAGSAAPLNAARDSLGCTPQLLSDAAPYDSTRPLALVGHYRWVLVDTLSTRRPPDPPPPGEPARTPAVPEVPEFVLRLPDSATEAPRPRHRLIGAIVGWDTTGFSLGHPQIWMDQRWPTTLTIAYDPRVGMILDGGDIVEDIPITVAGPWGFGAYYERWSMFLVTDRLGRRVPAFAGFYCALRIGR